MIQLVYEWVDVMNCLAGPTGIYVELIRLHAVASGSRFMGIPKKEKE